jgi:hypothetical protein
MRERGRGGGFGLAGGSFGINFTQRNAQIFVVRLVINIVNIDVADDSFLIHDEKRPFRFTLGTEDVVFFGNRAMRPEIAEEGEADTTQAFSPGLQAGNMVNADAQDLGI